MEWVDRVAFRRNAPPQDGTHRSRKPVSNDGSATVVGRSGAVNAAGGVGDYSRPMGDVSAALASIAGRKRQVFCGRVNAV